MCYLKFLIRYLVDGERVAKAVMAKGQVKRLKGLSLNRINVYIVFQLDMITFLSESWITNVKYREP